MSEADDLLARMRGFLETEGLALCRAADTTFPRTGGALDSDLRGLVNAMAPPDVVKRGILEAMLDEHDSVLIAVDRRVDGVSLPPNLPGDIVVLRLGRNLTPPIHMDLNEVHLVAVLSFNGVLQSCIIPWEAIMQIGPEGAAPAKRAPTLRLVP